MAAILAAGATAPACSRQPRRGSPTLQPRYVGVQVRPRASRPQSRRPRVLNSAENVEL